MILSSDDVLASSLEQFQNDILSLYDKKTAQTAEREVARYKYLVWWRNQFESIAALVRDKVLMASNPDASIILDRVFQSILTGTPMVGMDAAWTVVYPSFSSYYYINAAPPELYFFAPTKTFLEKMTGTNPAVTRNDFEILYRNRVEGGQPFWVFGGITQWNIPYPNYPVAPPYSLAVIKKTATLDSKYVTDPEKYNDAFTIVYQALTDTTLSGSGMSFTDVLLNGRAIRNNLYAISRNLYYTESEVVAAETRLADFIKSAKETGLIDPAADYSDIYKALLDSKMAQKVAVEQIVIEAPAIAESETSVEAPVQVAEQKSKLNWKLAAAAVGIYFATRGEGDA